MIGRIPTARKLLASLVLVLASPPAVLAASRDYAFQFVQPEVAQGADAKIAVRLVDKRTGDAVPDAVIFATRLDMAPDGMEAMTTSVEALPSTEAGIYNFKVDLSMEGGWRLKLAAKVQGELETVQGELILRVTP
jgi:hypothetical protein